MAARVKALVRPALLVWARETAGFKTPAAAAARLDLDTEVLTAWESEETDEAPSVAQLRKLADVYKRPLAVFYLAEPPVRFQVIRDFRRINVAGQSYSPDLVMEMRRAEERRHLAIELAEDLGDEPRAFDLQTRIGGDPERVGAAIRASLGVTDELQKAWRDNDGRNAFRAWRAKIEDAGALVFQMTNVSSDEASGFAIAQFPLPAIAVNQKDALTRRSYSLLHELAHLMLRLSGVSDLEEGDRPVDDRLVETFCNEVAAAALVPAATLLRTPQLREVPDRFEGWEDREIAELARAFSVSREVLLRRILTVGRTTQAFYEEKRADYIAAFRALRERQREKSADQEIRRNMPLEAISNLGRPLVALILETYFSDRLSLSEAAGYLGLKTKHLPKLERLASTR